LEKRKGNGHLHVPCPPAFLGYVGFTMDVDAI
jgi:hypothetical protein